MAQENQPGIIVLLGSGETLPSSRIIHEFVLKNLPPEPKVVILETPAGFEQNSPTVAGRIKEFLEQRLQNYNPRVSVLPARKKGSDYSPDDEGIVSPILDADEILLGPGSPTYAVKELKDSLAFEMIRARVRKGASLFLSSSATLAFGAYTMPVYEIYKVGEDPHWKKGLNFFKDYGLNLAVIPHWDNHDGGEDLDTSRCYLGQERFNWLREMLPKDITVVGIDEHTGFVLDFKHGCADVMGKGRVTIMGKGKERVIRTGEELPLEWLGKEWRVPKGGEGIDDYVWQKADHRHKEMVLESQRTSDPPDEVVTLAKHRAEARGEGDWGKADELRRKIESMGWQVNDTSEGYELFQLQG
jgi:cyanophycinase-like exopeptidase